MLVVFCLRLATGLLASLLLLPAAEVMPRFYRVHFLTALGLLAAALAFALQTADAWLLTGLGVSLVLAFAGSVVWSLPRAPGGQTWIILTTLTAGSTLALAERAADPSQPWGWLLAGGYGSAALLGVATTAMLLGHFYLIATGMTIAPLLRVLRAFFTALLLRLAVSALALGYWMDTHALFNLNDANVLWLPVRWGVGFVLPFGLGWMAWQAAKIRSTQSATGILYVVVICCFLGELTGQLLQGNSGLSM